MLMKSELTLRQAQKFAFKIFKKIEKESKVVKGDMWNPFIIVTDLLEEAGEVAAAVKGLEGYKPPDKPKTRGMLAAELSDLLYSIFALAEYYEIDLENAFTKTISNYLERFTKNKSE